ncbi:uncharacterized protein LOC143817799 [Ranitomeya variabilis]|uniref:uncharacterized protein LOC143817344 n=1 Tax=Ranitomeya variabilis TaxID=490064 RepID=UPI00405606C6
MSSRELRQLIMDNIAWMNRPENRNQSPVIGRLRSSQTRGGRIEDDRDYLPSPERRRRVRDPSRRSVPEETRHRSRSPHRPLPDRPISPEPLPPTTRPDNLRPAEVLPPTTLPDNLRPAEALPPTTLPDNLRPAEALPPTTRPDNLRPAEVLPPTTRPDNLRPAEVLPPTTLPDNLRPVEALPPTTLPDRHSSADASLPSSSNNRSGGNEAATTSGADPQPRFIPPSVGTDAENQAGLDSVEDTTPPQAAPLRRRGRRRGMTRIRQIERLPTRSATGQEEIPSCAICLGDYEVGEQLIVLPCRHLFHQSCITPWLRQNRYCPYCRQNCFQQNRQRRA